MNGFPPANSGGSGGTITTSAPLSGDGSSGTPATIADGAIAAAKLASAAVTGPKIASGALLSLKVYGLAAPGSIVLPGALLGMRVFSIGGLDITGSPPTLTNLNVATDFEPTGLISVAGHLKQTTDADLSNTILDVLLVAAS
jgi:hypothetical protein